MKKSKRGWYHLLFKCPTWWHSWWTGRGWYRCPICDAGMSCYYDGNDCAECGSLGVCDDCFLHCCLVTDPEGRNQ